MAFKQTHVERYVCDNREFEIAIYSDGDKHKAIVNELINGNRPISAELKLPRKFKDPKTALINNAKLLISSETSGGFDIIIIEESE